MSLPIVKVVQETHTVSLVGRVKKRIIVCCDGTWEDGTSENETMYTNVVRLARAIDHEDTRSTPPIPQVVYYQSGIGSEKNFYAEYIEGPMGSSLADKVEEAYAFIAQNYHSGDEIFLFGFSRGAYTARMVAMFIGAIGILDRREMDNFARIFILYQKLGKSNDDEEINTLKAQLATWNAPDSPGRQRVLSGDQAFSIKCIGVFDTVGALGLPDELRIHPKVHNLFGFPDKRLGEHVERAYQALALNEPREDFDCCKFKQTEQGRRKKQILRQCWFSGCHSDCGGGYRVHDLADLTLTWMVAHLVDILSVDIKYLASLLKPVAPWGAQLPHSPLTGMYRWAKTIQRPLPDSDDDITHETIHSSVLLNEQNFARISEHIAEHPGLVPDLLPLEEHIKALWPTYSANHTQKEKREESRGVLKLLDMIVNEI